MISFKKVTKTYGKRTVVSNTSFFLEEGEVLVLLGGSGSGKTTLLKMLIRLVDPTSGLIEVNGQDHRLMDLICLRRQVGYAIQGTGLFAHRNVYQNIAIVLQLLGKTEEFIRKRVQDLLEMVGLNPVEFSDKYPHELSGGQGQRVGVARALAHNPPIIMMDEPFGGLDPLTRQQLQEEFLALQSRLRKTVLFVTHDIDEAVKMGDRIGIMQQGVLVQIDTPHNLVMRPESLFVKEFLSHQKFEILLMTKKLIEMPLTKQLQAAGTLMGKQSALDALNYFVETNASAVAIYEGTTFLGNLSRQTLQELVNQILAGE